MEHGRYILFLLTFTVVTVTVMAQTPTISAFSPASGAVGTTVTISGTGFNTTLANNIVYFNATRATVTSAAATSLTVTVPAGAAYGPVQVLNTGTGLTGYSRQSFVPTFNGPCATTFSAGSFNAKSDFTVGSGPYGVKIGDVDGDGKADIVCANLLGNTLSVLRNTTSGGTVAFAAKVDYATGSAPHTIAMGDVDNDGKPDLVAVNNSSTTISVYRNTSTSGTVSFATQVGYTTGAGPRDVAFGDMDGDGKMDLVVTNFNANTVSVLRNTSTGPGSVSFAAKVDFATGSAPWVITAADLDGDRKTDLVVANNSSNTVSVLRNTSTGTSVVSFATKVDYATGTGPRSIFSGDIDGDGKTDIAVSNYNDYTLSILRNTSSSGSVSFAAKVDYATGAHPLGVAMGDVDGDGRLEVIVPNNDNSSVGVFRNNSTSGSISLATRVDYTTGSYPWAVAVGDLTGDGQPELAVANSSPNTISVLKNALAVSPITASAGANASSNTVCDNGVWKTLYNSSSNTAVASIKDNGQNLGALSATVYVDAQPGIYKNKPYLARHYKVSITTQPSAAVQVRLYFTDAELQALKAADPTVQSVSDLNVTKYSGANEDGTIDFSGGTVAFIPNTSITTGQAYGANYIEFTVTGFSEFWIHSGTGPLPVKLVSFTAEKEGTNVTLHWTTAQEQNAERFIVERSNDGLTYTSIGSVAASGTSTEKHIYRYTDNAPVNGLNYYRLQQVDLDGQRDVSRVITLRWATAAGVHVVMSYTGNRQVQARIEGRVNNGSLQLYDGMGRQVKSYRVNTGDNGSMRLDMELGALSPGVYLYRLMTTEGRVSSGKIVLQ